MFINQIRLTNFKLFENLTIDTRPLTLLTGCNSSGKSSVINALAAIAQTEMPYAFPFEFVPNGTNCALGSYKDVVRGHATNKSFGIGLCATHQKTHVCLNASYRYSPRGDHILPFSTYYKVKDDELMMDWMGTDIGYRCQFNAQSLKIMRSDVAYKRFVHAIEQYTVAQIKKHGKGEARVSELRRKLLSTPSRRTSYNIAASTSPRDIPEKINEYPTGSYLLENLLGFIREFQRTIGFMGPVRAMPLRYYTPDRPHATVDPTGKNTAQLLADWYKHDTGRFKKTLELLNVLELTNSLTPKSDADDILKMLVQPFARSETANLADVGFGVSQALPFVVADVALPPSSVLMVNQPEVHLHPTAQAQLANYFSSMLDKRQYLIETHSEYLINRLRVLAQRKEIDPSKVLIVFLAPDASKKQAICKYDIELTPKGGLKGAPKQFFDTYYTDSFALAMGADE